MEVSADLTIEVAGIVSTLTGDGQDLVLHSADPATVLGVLASSLLPVAVGAVDGPRALGRMGEALETAGLRLELAGPRGVYLTLGRTTSSPVGRLLTRSSHVQPGRPAALQPLISAEVARRVGRPRRVLVVGVLAAGLVVAVGRRLRQK